MATEAFVNNKVQESGLSGDVPNITYLSPTSANAIASFTEAGTHFFTLPSFVKTIKVTTVGGGGAGSSSYCGDWWCYWGGGGGMITENVAINIGTNKQVQIVVGAGGVHNFSTKGLGNGGASYIQYNGVTYAKSNGGYGYEGYRYNTNGSYYGYAGGPGGGKGGKATYFAPERGKYGTVYIYNNDSRYWSVGGGSWGNGAGINSSRKYVAPGIGGGGTMNSLAGNQITNGGAGAVFINY